MPQVLRNVIVIKGRLQNFFRTTGTTSTELGVPGRWQLLLTMEFVGLESPTMQALVRQWWNMEV